MIVLGKQERVSAVYRPGGWLGGTKTYQGNAMSPSAGFGVTPVLSEGSRAHQGALALFLRG